MTIELTYEQLRELLYYDPDTGIFTWRMSRGSSKAGNRAGSLNARGYVQIQLLSKLYLAHRLAWLWCFKEWPKGMLDHINGVRNDNRLCNLREASALENQHNRNRNSNNTTGYRGVSWRKDNNKYQAQISINGNQTHLGYYTTAKEASQAYEAAAIEYYKEFKRENTI